MIKAIIGIPSGDDRRRHMSFDKSGFVDLGPIKEVIPVNGGVCPVAYGFIPGTKNPADNDELDILVLSKKDFKVGEEVEVESIALLRRADGDEKVIARDETAKENINSWEDIALPLRNLIQEFFGFSSKIISIEGKDKAEELILDLRIDN